MIIFVRFSDEAETKIVSVFSVEQPEGAYPNMGQLEDDDPRYLAFLNPAEDPENMAIEARAKRDGLLRGTYDPGILMAQRALRMAITPEDIAYATGKVSELDVFADALQKIPEQSGFPQTIIWPVTPTK